MTATLAYDYEDRLTHLEGLGVSQNYTYNGADARVGKSGTGGSRTYRRDGVGVTSPVLSDGQATMVPGISEKINAGGNRFSHLDRLGTNAKTTDTSGNVIDSRSYDAFGVPVSVSNPSNSEQGFASAFGYQEDGESGLKLLGPPSLRSGYGPLPDAGPKRQRHELVRLCGQQSAEKRRSDGAHRAIRAGLRQGERHELHGSSSGKDQ